MDHPIAARTGRALAAGALAALLLVLCAGAAAAAPRAAQELLTQPGAPGLLAPPAASADKSPVGRSGRLPVVSLRGGFRQMGRQYGAMLSGDIRRLNRDVQRIYDELDIAIPGLSLRDFSTRSLDLYPIRFKNFARGVAEGAHVPLAVVAENTEFFEYFAAFIGPESDAAAGACSAISAWGPYAKGGTLVMGRDYDFPNFYRTFDRALAVVVLHPTDGSAATALLTWAGSVGAISGFSEHGFVLENNDGSSYGDPNRHFLTRTPFMVHLPQVLLDQTSTTGVDAAMRSYRGPYPLIWNLATREAGYVYETTTYEVKRRDGEDGLAVGVNHFVDPSWPLLPTRSVPAIEYSELRQGNLVALAEASKGEIGVARMKSIMDTMVEDGGATPKDENIYRFVAVPQTLQWWIRVPEHVDWVRVDLRRLFRASTPRLTVLTASTAR